MLLAMKSLVQKSTKRDFQNARLSYFDKKPVPCHYQLFLASHQKSQNLNAKMDCWENERTARPHLQLIPASLGRYLSKDGCAWKQLWQLHHDAIHKVRTFVIGTDSESDAIFLSTCFIIESLGSTWERNISPWFSGSLAVEQWLSIRTKANEKGCCRYPCLTLFTFLRSEDMQGSQTLFWGDSCYCSAWKYLVCCLPDIYCLLKAVAFSMHFCKPMFF